MPTKRPLHCSPGRERLPCVYSQGQPSVSRHFYYNSRWQVLEERVATLPIPNPQSPIPVCQYVWGRRYVDDLVLRDRDTTGDSTLDERLYALQDPNWNIVALADITGTVVERYRYNAYGMVAICDPAGTPRAGGSLYAASVLYTGRRSTSRADSTITGHATTMPNWEGSQAGIR